MLKILNSFAKDESGATAIEYGLIAALVALAGVAAFTTLGESVSSAFEAIATTLDDAVTVTPPTDTTTTTTPSG